MEKHINKNWKGNANSIFKCLGASNHTEKERHPEEYYASEPLAAELLLSVEPDLSNILECAAGEGHLAKVFDKYGKLGGAIDLVDRGYCSVKDFFELNEWDGDIVTNPPYKFAQDFVEHSLDIVPDGRKVCMFLKIQFLEGQKRGEMFKKFPPKVIYVSSSRLLCAKNGKFEEMRKGGGSAVAYAWFVWVKGFKGDTIVKWIN